MITTHKITAELYDDSFKLIALHCSLNDYAMAYNINKAVALKLERSIEDLDVANFSFPIFEWKDDSNDANWTLVSNAITKTEKRESFDLFNQNNEERTHYLIEERKEVDYFLKIEENANCPINTIVTSINKIPKVITAYNIDAASLKSKRNLIF
ncbi:IPExxxVDY family protein [Croceitalea rosinachiae]|uniref:IPExxxVDY family protein n=1 Tax=Croceitalea rosinachiae TaxID=3075596 RepID=A0ABU3A8D1_9FLAO|nr:IPExxxVDY family protein [Croceitalea sp. F388]MDT0606447.1 IPExxxVDY family protein [Croceitalea sp. F388]